MEVSLINGSIGAIDGLKRELSRGEKTERVNRDLESRTTREQRKRAPLDVWSRVEL